ncbi:type 1 fimbrial protein [Variovorax sp. EL159]|uniref:type 1 fimbrial protein n=1 Tax=Variovorax sp. EL159 TaxID=1566270 RepID=UPI00088C855C|nr:type 1 fimbrial protein [Variovorax sp. EL159]SCX66807.1 hypothetical protein SAMN03159363_2851 [Variovorax sp. EL159]
MTRHDLRSRVFATLGFLFMGAASLGANAADGTIHFTGEIVAAPYEMRVVAKAPAVTHRVVAASTTEVVFLRQWVDRPSARVRVDALGGLPLATAFTDAKGHRNTFDPAGEQHVGLDGGTLSIKPQGLPPAGRMAGAMVTVSYN